MNLRQLGSALQDGDVLGINIITHSGLNRYAVQVITRDAGPLLLIDRKGQPIFWLSLGQLKASLRRHGVGPPPLQVTVAQDEVVGR